MTCKRARRWISDEIDGVLGEKNRQRLTSHVDACPACRAYHQDLLRLQAQSKTVQTGPVSPEYFENFSAAVETKLRTAKQSLSPKALFPLRWKWAWLALPLAMAIVIGLLFFRGGGKEVRNDIFFFEACLDRVFQEIGDDEAAAADFNRLLSGAVLGGGEDVMLEDDAELLSEPFFWRSLSDEDLRLIEEEIKRSLRS